MPQLSKKTAKDSHYARLRRQHRTNQQLRNLETGEVSPQDRVRLYGLHTVTAALANPKRHIHNLMITQNAYDRLKLTEQQLPIEPQFCSPRQLDQLLGSETVHQGVMLETNPLKPRALHELENCHLVVVLDQISDPHNVGALMRSSVAFNAGALITTTRHSAKESGVLAKAASGALELLDYITVGNLARALETLHAAGFTTIGLDSNANMPLEQALTGNKIALILGNEGKGLRQKTREVATQLARLDMPGIIKSLNVSNAGALSLYIVNRFLHA